MVRKILPILLVLWVLPVVGQYDGPRPPKADVPYLLQADHLIATEVTEAKEEDRKEGQVFVIAGAASPVKTPMAEPIFLFQSDKIQAGSLQLFRLEVNGGNREVNFGNGKKHKNGARPLRLDVKQLGSNLFRIEAYNTLDPGEYSLSPSDSNAAFCFAVY
jgi:hypothetical protein